jgi:threonine synthase
VKIAVPSGNYGNITAGLLARRMGLKLGGFIAASNANTVVPDFLSGGEYSPEASKATLANAMDVGDPSNFVRMRELYGGIDSDMRADLGHFSMTDSDILATIKDCYERTGYTLDPHGAIGYKAIKNAGGGIFLETAHPAKFKATVEQAIGHEIELPPALAETFVKEGESMTFTTDFGAFKEYLLGR